MMLVNSSSAEDKLFRILCNPEEEHEERADRENSFFGFIQDEVVTHVDSDVLDA
jgi:hypothetical protein